MNSSPSPRYAPQSASRQIRPRSQEVVDYHYDEQKPGKPLLLLIPGALVVLGALGLIVLLIAVTYGDQPKLDQTVGTILIVVLIPIYVGGVFLFSYGYELYDVPKAIRLTIIIVLITLAAVFMFAVLVFVLAAIGKSKSSSSSSSSSSLKSFSSGGGGNFLGGMGPIFIGGLSPTQTVTREVVREVPVPSPAPQPIACSHCGRPYVPEENKYACPNCGAPTPSEFVPK